MLLKDLWTNYEFYTRVLTEHSRKLAFGAAALCWFFKTPQVTFPIPILWSLIFIVLFFFLDILQYLCGAIFLGIWTRAQEKKMCKEKSTLTEEINKPAWVDKPMNILFFLKIGILLVSFMFLGIEFISHLNGL